MNPLPVGQGSRGSGARVLREAAEVLSRLLRIPGELRDPHVRSDRHGPAAAVLVRLQRGVDAEVRPADVGGQDARVVRAGLATVVERDGHRAVRAGRDRRLELVGRRAGASTLSLTTTGVVQVAPPSVDCVNFTSIWPATASQSS